MEKLPNKENTAEKIRNEKIFKYVSNVITILETNLTSQEKNNFISGVLEKKSESEGDGDRKMVLKCLANAYKAVDDGLVETVGDALGQSLRYFVENPTVYFVLSQLLNDTFNNSQIDE